MYKGYFDGASKNNPGHAGIGIVILDQNNKEVLTYSKYLGVKTNNEAEYLALIELLEKAKELGIEEINIFGDSQLVVNQVNGNWRINQSHLFSLAQKVEELITQFKNISINWIPREKNTIADRLSNEAIIQSNDKNTANVQLEKVKNHIYIAYGKEEYVVDTFHRSCSCPDYQMRKNICKHLKKALELEETKIN